MTREWAGVVADALAAEDRTRRPSSGSPSGIVGTVRQLRDNELFVRIVELDPELILPYLFSRRGRSQELILALTADAIARGPGGRRDPRAATRSPWPGRCCSPPTASCSRRTRWSTTRPPRHELDAELATLITRTLAP